MREDEIRRMTQMHALADYLQKDLPAPPTTPPPATAKAPPPPPPTYDQPFSFRNADDAREEEKTNCPPTTALDFNGANIRLPAQVKFRRNQ